MVLNRQDGNPLGKLFSLMTRETLAAMQNEVARTFIHEMVVKYIVDLITATRNSEDILRGASPRATLAVTSMSKAMARLRGRDYVVPGDVREVFPWTIAHRLLLSSKTEGQGRSAEDILKQIIEQTPAPKMR